MLFYSVHHKPEKLKPRSVKDTTVIHLPKHIWNTAINDRRGWDVLLIHPAQAQSINFTKVFEVEIDGMYDGAQPNTAGILHQCISERWRGYFSPAKHGKTKVISMLSVTKYVTFKSSPQISDTLHLHWIDLFPKKKLRMFRECTTNNQRTFVCGTLLSILSVRSIIFEGSHKNTFSLIFPFSHRKFEANHKETFDNDWNCSLHQKSVALSLSTHNGTWVQAHKMCTSHNCTLPILNSKEDQREIIDLLKFMFIGNAPHIYPLENILFVGMISRKVSACVCVRRDFSL